MLLSTICPHIIGITEWIIVKLMNLFHLRHGSSVCKLSTAQKISTTCWGVQYCQWCNTLAINAVPVLISFQRSSSIVHCVDTDPHKVAFSSPSFLLQWSHNYWGVQRTGPLPIFPMDNSSLSPTLPHLAAPLAHPISPPIPTSPAMHRKGSCAEIVKGAPGLIWADESERTARGWFWSLEPMLNTDSRRMWVRAN